MHDILEQKLAEYNDLKDKISRPDAPSNPAYVLWLKKWGAMQKLSVPLIALKKAEDDWKDAVSIVDDPESDPEFVELAQAEKAELEERMDALIDQLEEMLVTTSEDSGKNAVVELRAGVGGAESAIFVGDLFDMYKHYIDSRSWKMTVMDFDSSDQGGFKEVTFIVKHPDAFDRLRFEGGIHRVQRVPKTESQGRIHTSAVSVAIMPEAEDIEITVPEKDLEISVMRSQGPGGQSVNTTDSCVRIVHLPTGIAVKCQIEKSQLQNRVMAMKILRTKLYELERDKRNREARAQRAEQTGTGDRSGRIRTYNFPQNRVTDHRLDGADKNFPLDDILSGNLDPLINALIRATKLKSSLKRIS